MLKRNNVWEYGEGLLQACISSFILIHQGGSAYSSKCYVSTYGLLGGGGGGGRNILKSKGPRRLKRLR